MLESMTIFNKGGLVLYQYTANPTILDKEHGGSGGPAFTQQVLNKYFFPILLDPATPKNKSYAIVAQRITFCWKQLSEFIIVAVYPDILFEGPRLYLQQWAQALVQKTASEYQQYYQQTALAQEEPNEQDDEKEGTEKYINWIIQAPDPKPFDKVFRILLEQSKTQKQQEHQQQQQPPTDSAAAADDEEPSATSKTDAKKGTGDKGGIHKKGKEKRQWHDGKAKVTQEAMNDLDMSKKQSEQDKAQAQERALQEARAAYLPTEQDLQQQETLRIDTDSTASAASSIQQQSGGILADFFAHLTGNKILTDADLDGPLTQMEQLLTSKNVAAEIANELCQGVRLQLRGKKLTQLYRVQTAVQQALETTLSQLLKRNQIDLMQKVVQKRRLSDFSILNTKRTPFVIVVIGINGVGKSTSLAKLTYYFKQNGCNPLLVAGDTFRSGAVEQLAVHAKCLEVPIFAQGYAKDPSAVAKAAIQQATTDGNDVVLIDTAGRMQNNAPLMKALGKLVQENSPDFIILVCEALVGHDGLDQFQMFQQALGHCRKLDGLLLTKFDTVSDKVGAALTLTHQTGAPIVFCGNGQKYHHLQKLEPSGIINALFS